jgi:hypothetical protein
MPLNVQVGGLQIHWSTAEITGVRENFVSFRQGIAVERASFAGSVEVGPGARVVQQGSGSSLVHFEPGAKESWVRTEA